MDDFSIYLTHLANSYVAQGNQQIWLVLMAAVSALALWRGGEPERVAAVGVLVAWFLTPLAQVPIDLYDPQWGMLAVDTAFLGLLLTLALRSNRIWLLFAAAFQLLGVVIHMAIVVDPSLPLPARIPWHNVAAFGVQPEEIRPLAKAKAA